MADKLTLAELLKKSFDGLSPAEKRVSRVLIADYPVAGLEPVQKLADRANVSAPTVLRLLSKLGIGSYPQLQDLLREEIMLRTWSPIDMYAEGSEAPGSEVPKHETIAHAQRVFETGLQSTFASLPEGEFDAIVQLLANEKRRIWTVGGRYSGLLAQYLALHLKLLRRDVQFVGDGESDKTFALLDFGPRDVLIAFDYRRYQESTVAFLQRAKEQRATTVLLTDPWLSPAAKHADHLLSNSVVAPSPFDSLTPAFALVETLIAGAVTELGSQPKARIQAFDHWEYTVPDSE